MLSDRDIRAALDSQALVIDPLDERNIQPASVDLTLGAQFAALPRACPLIPSYIDPLSPPVAEMQHRTVAPGEGYPLPPYGFALATTTETVTLGAGLLGTMAGKSSLARWGLIVEAAGYVDPGFTGQLTCELFNMTEHTIMLSPGMLIAQLAVQRLVSPAARPYGHRALRSHYQGQVGPTPSRAHLPGGVAACPKPVSSSANSAATASRPCGAEPGTSP